MEFKAYFLREKCDHCGIGLVEVIEYIDNGIKYVSHGTCHYCFKNTVLPPEKYDEFCLTNCFYEDNESINIKPVSDKLTMINIDPSMDGINHINIYSNGKTELGRLLSNFHKFRIETKYGFFESVEALWHWLGIADCEEKEALRTLHGLQAKKVGSELKAKHGKRDEKDFENIILTAIWYKARRNQKCFLGPQGKFPFEHYYIFGGKVVDVKEKYSWLINGIDKIRKHIRKMNNVD